METIAPGLPLLAVAVRYDAGRGVIALASIPPGLVRAIGTPRLRVHGGHRLPGS
jgi:hypothetical protein